MGNPGLLDDFQRALPDFAAEDNVGSPYCVRRYVVDEHLGGAEGTGRGPQGTGQTRPAPHPRFRPEPRGPGSSVGQRRIPEYFIQGNAEDARKIRPPSSSVGARCLPAAAIPYFPAWPDVLQLNAFQPGLAAGGDRDAVSDIAAQCDGIRCDMAMLMLNDDLRAHLGSAGRSQAGGGLLDGH